MGIFATPVLDHQALPVSAVVSGFKQALAAARSFEGATAPNPPVGCVLLDAAGSPIAIGAHARAGAPHAEAQAIAVAERLGRLDDVRTVIVTLEPCNHTGRTPPCVDAILRTSAQTVWIGVMDPNTKVAGGGAMRLLEAGLDVRTIDELDSPDALDLAMDAARLIAPFALHQRTGLPYVTVKQAINREGTMLPPAGQTTFTSQDSLTLAHLMRRRAGAILTGSGTVLADDASFTVRYVPDFDYVRRHLVIMDRRGRVSDDYLAAAEARRFIVSRETSIEDALQRLGDAGVIEVLVEAGPELTEEILQRGLWNEHVRIVQGAEGEPDDVQVRYRAEQSVGEA